MSGAKDERTDFQRLADEVRRQIAAAGLSQREVAERLGWGRGYVSQLLTGVVGLKVKHVFQILELLEVPPGEFFANLAEEFGVHRPVQLTEESVASFEERLKSAVAQEVQAVLERLVGKRQAGGSGEGRGA